MKTSSNQLSPLEKCLVQCRSPHRTTWCPMAGGPMLRTPNTGFLWENVTSWCRGLSVPIDGLVK